MLNPRTYLEDCLRAGKMSLWTTEFPWQLINSAIDSKTFDYNPGEESMDHFIKTTGRLWENTDESDEKELKCISCSQSFTVPWTRGDIGPTPDAAFKTATGYADNSFSTNCANCLYKHDHDTLRVSKFTRDVSELLMENRPMPGTLLNLHGLPERLTDMMFANLMFKHSKATAFDQARLDGTIKDMLEVRKLIESLMDDANVRGAILLRRGMGPNRQQRITVRRMMSRYWENSSIFGLDLVGAVIRQGTFVAKMDNIDWIHSPAVSATMDRLIRKYGIFFDIMASAFKQIAVPTLDVDLAWHTHQLSPRRYFTYSKTRTSSAALTALIDHDDKIDEDKLSDAFEWTSKKYKEVTNGELYSECTCWYCEATRESFLYRGLVIPTSSTKRARTLAENLHDDPRISSDPDKNPHISAHNAVHAKGPVAMVSANMTYRTLQLRQMWEKAHRRAMKRQQKQRGNNNKNGGDPKNGGNGSGSGGSSQRSGYDPYGPYYPMVYGYPYFMPFYAPYMADPYINAEAYAYNPACMNTTIGSYGNCAAGTCGAGVAAGSCGGAGGSSAGAGGGACAGAVCGSAGFGGTGCGGFGGGGGC